MDSIEFWEEMTNLGMHILLSLPNGTECQAELDQMFSEFKPQCQRSTIQVAGMKMAARVMARKKPSLDAGSDSDNNLSCGEVSKKKRSICNVSLTARDFSNGEVLDLELPVVRNATLLADEDATVDHIVKNQLINKAGGLFKAGMIANSCAVVRAAKRIVDKQKALEAAQKKKDQQETLQSEAMMAFGRWKADGYKSNDDGPQLKKSDALVII